MNLNKSDYKICVVGMGYVGLPLAARLSLKEFNVVGFDINETRVQELCNNVDRNNDIELANLKILNQNSQLTSNSSDIKDCNIFIITVPTPINDDKTPNLDPIIASSRLIGSLMMKESIIIYESTVYPGVTDDICTPILEKESNLLFNKDFSTGYSPERIVPGDKVNTIENIKKVVSASNLKALKIISFLYSSIIDAGIHEAPSIKVAEASKVTENIQRDVNIALINEMHQLYSSLGISTNDVIDAAATKWNFMKLSPGLVGGHCISIDPYYLIDLCNSKKINSNVIQISRKFNENFINYLKKLLLSKLKNKYKDKKVLFLGATFKENCSDIRNTKVYDLAISLKNHGVNVSIWDPFLTNKTQDELSKNDIISYKKKPKKIELAFICVYHDQILEFLKCYKGIVFDYKKLNKSK